LLGNTDTVRKLFNEVAPGMYQKSSGYTRIVKYKNRPGDGAPLAIMELVE
jgi:large subunit ribosomal protein L17